MKQSFLVRALHAVMPVVAVFGLSCESPEGASGEQAAAATPASACGAPEHVASLRGLSEASGLALAGKRDLWTHNDSERPPHLYRLDPGGRVVQRVRVPAMTDWEDIAAAACESGACLYLADIGDNLHQRSSVRVLRIPAPGTSTSAISRADVFPFRYPEGPSDAEAIFVLPGERLFVITKGRNRPATLYRYPGPLRAEAVTLEPVRALQEGLAQFPDMVTGASATSDGRFLAVRTYGYVDLYRVNGEDLVAIERVPLDALDEKQGEGVALRDDGEILLVGEGGSGTLGRLRCRLPSQ